MPRIDATDVSLTFTVRQQKRISLKEYVVRGLFMGSSNPKVAVHALSGINLHLRDGDRVGVIGHNGAGKSTLLKTLAGIYPPTTGTYEVEGKICSLFDITLGFEMDANGWDNIRYRAYLQGETPATVKNKIDAIAEFSELGEFLNVPVRYYSSGMMMRLAFSIATVVDPEVLLIDEVLAVGDLAFQAKAQARMKEIMAAAGLMVLVSHDLGTVRNMCNRVLWLEHGRVRLEGDTEEVIAAYTAHATGQPAPALAAAA